MTAPMLSLPPMHTARLLVYEIPISRPTVPSRFFMASTPMLVRRARRTRNQAPSFLSRRGAVSRTSAAHGDAQDSVHIFLNKVAFVASIFLLALLIAYLTH